jgi:hypothetical protein
LRKILETLFICLILLGMTTTAETTTPQINSQNLVISLATSPRGTSFDYAVLIIMENHSLCSIVGNITIGCTTSTIAPYETKLAQNYALATNYTALVHPSLGNYLALVGGSTFNVTQTCSPKSNPCGSDHLCCPTPAANIVDRFDQTGLTWKAYAEDYPSGCTSASFVLPFNYFQDIYSNATRCARLVKANTVTAGTTLGNPDIFLNDLGSTATASNFMWLTPSICDQWHELSCSGFGGTSYGDIYLSIVVPKILNSAVFTTQRAALFIVYDEGTGGCKPHPCSGSTDDYIYAVWAGPQVKRGYMCNASYSHYSFLSTLEWNWGLKNLTSNDGSARPMNELFTNGPACELQTGFIYNLRYIQSGQAIAFSALASGGVQPYSYTWTFGDGGIGTGQNISHTYQKAGSYTTTLTLTDASGTATTASRVLSITPAPPSSTQPPPSNGICLLCLIQGNSTALLLIGIPVGLTVAIVFATFVKRRHRKPIPRLPG